MRNPTHSVRRMIKASTNLTDKTHGYDMMEYGPRGKTKTYVNMSHTKIRSGEFNILEKICLSTGKTTLISSDEFKWIASQWQKRLNPTPAPVKRRRKTEIIKSETPGMTQVQKDLEFAQRLKQFIAKHS